MEFLFNDETLDTLLKMIECDEKNSISTMTYRHLLLELKKCYKEITDNNQFLFELQEKLNRLVDYFNGDF